MPIAPPPIPDSSQNLVLSEHPQLLIVCLLAGLFLCGAIVLYANQVKGKAALLAQDSYSGGSAAAVPPSDSTVPSPALGTVAIDRSQHPDVSLNVRQDKQSGIAGDHKAPTDRGGRTEPASQRVAVTKPGWRKLSPTPTARGSVSVNLFRTRSRNSFPSHHRTTLIALWRQSLRRHQNDKLSHVTSNPST
jgi:hypothetical protein